uniref:Src kinase-associated phosphoprotein 2-like n=1 Tax=Castor canadensis TaxID=51338 RepID=A0A8B7UH96_CASCN|nr:src kinase-associated phosphoprotein 2-like [Castor canadensis]
MPNPSSTSSPCPLPEEIRNLLADVETFVADILKGENLSKKAKEKREYLIKKIKDVKSIYLQEFQDKGDAEEGEEYDDPFAGPPDTISLASERYDKDDDAPSDGMRCFPRHYMS